MANSRISVKPAAARKALAKSLSASKVEDEESPIAGVDVDVKSFPGIAVTLIDSDFFSNTNLYRVDPQVRIAAIRQGIPATLVGALSSTMGMSKELLLGSLGLSRATIGRKEKHETTLSKDESERVLGVACLIGKVQTMVEESGEVAGFDAARWVGDWLAKPLPALGAGAVGERAR